MVVVVGWWRCRVVVAAWCVVRFKNGFMSDGLVRRVWLGRHIQGARQARLGQPSFPALRDQRLPLGPFCAAELAALATTLITDFYEAGLRDASGSRACAPAMDLLKKKSRKTREASKTKGTKTQTRVGGQRASQLEAKLTGSAMKTGGTLLNNRTA